MRWLREIGRVHLWRVHLVYAAAHDGDGLRVILAGTRREVRQLHAHARERGFTCSTYLIASGREFFALLGEALWWTTAAVGSTTADARGAADRAGRR